MHQHRAICSSLQFLSAEAPFGLFSSPHREQKPFRLLLNTCVCFLFADFEILIKELFKPQLEELGVTQPGSSFTSDDLFSLLESPSNPRVGVCRPLWSR